jgi:hypothetical protein
LVVCYWNLLSCFVAISLEYISDFWELSVFACLEIRRTHRSRFPSDVASIFCSVVSLFQWFLCDLARVFFCGFSGIFLFDVVNLLICVDFSKGSLELTVETKAASSTVESTG